MGLCKGLLFTFTDEELSPLSCSGLKPDKYLDVRFTYMNVVKAHLGLEDSSFHEASLEKEDGSVIYLLRNNNYYALSDFSKGEVKLWVKYLNSYCVRVDKPLNFKVIK